MINFWLTPNNRKVIRLTQLGSLGTLVMSASSSTPTITVGNSHFFTGQKKSLKHPSMLRQQKPLRHFQACSLKQKHLLQHTSMQTLFQTFHTRCMRVQRGSIYPKFVQACQETYCSSQQKLQLTPISATICKRNHALHIQLQREQVGFEQMLHLFVHA